MRALVYGAMNPDLVHVVDRLPAAGDDTRSRVWRITWGGKAANAAVALAGWGVEVRLLGLVLGQDPLGDLFLEALPGPRIDRSWIERHPTARTRHCVILLTPDGDRSIVCAGYAGATFQRVRDEAWSDVDVVLVDGFGGDAAVTVCAEAHRRGTPVVWLDAPIPPPVDVDLVVWSRTEHTSDEAARLGAGGRNVVLTAGAGAVVAHWAGGRFEVSPPPVAAVDTTGAGDVFAAACALGLASGWTPRHIVRWAAAAGAVSAHTGRSAPSTREQVDRIAGGAGPLLTP